MANPVAPAAHTSRSACELHEVLAAIESLYQDQVEPLGRILCKRLSERVPNAVHIDARRVRAICETCPWLHVEDKHGGDWCALIRGRGNSFVDVYSPQDQYHPNLWIAAAAYFEGLDDVEMVLPGGRYSCAQTLISRSLSFLSGLTLGQVSHIVQLAISQKRILGYLNGAVVPYGRSQSKIKDAAAEQGAQVATSSSGKGVKLADWKVLLEGIREILADVNSSGSVPLSNIKRMFRSRFDVEVSETALGHAKLSELFQDLRLHQTCTVKLVGPSYVVTKPTSPVARHIQLETALPQWPQTAVLSNRSPSFQVAPLKQSIPLQHTSADLSRSTKSLQARAHWVKPLEFAEAGPGSDNLMPVMTPTPCGNELLQHHIMPVSALEWENSCRALGLVPPTQGGQRSPPRRDSDSSIMSQSSQTGSPRSNRCTLTASTLENIDYPVQNTFLHAKVAPPTPSCSATVRSHSLPRNIRMASHTEKAAESGLQKRISANCKQADVRPANRPGNRLMSAAAAAAEVVLS